MATRPSFTLTETVEQFDISRSTLRRRLAAGAFPHAQQQPSGSWKIPVTDLITAGITPRKTWLNDTLTDHAHTQNELGHDLAHDLENRIKTLENDLAIERAHRQAAERIAAAEAARADTALTALRILETKTSVPPKHWWNRR